MGNLCCCFCCLSEGDQVGRVLDKFPASPVRGAQPGTLQKVVGRAVLAGQNAYYSPATNRPCVWFRVRVEEEFIEINRDPETGRERRTHHWRQVLQTERFVDFFLQDGPHKIFVQGSQRGTCRIQGTVTNSGRAGRTSFFTQPPPGIQLLIAQECPRWRGWGYCERHTGRFRYYEETFDVNELVVGLGVVQQPSPHQLVLCPISDDALTEEWMKANGWDSWDESSWHALLKTPAVFLSDKKKFTESLAPSIPIINELPAYMTTFVPAMSPWGSVGAPQQPYAQQPYAQQPGGPRSVPVGSGMGGGGVVGGIMPVGYPVGVAGVANHPNPLGGYCPPPPTAPHNF